MNRSVQFFTSLLIGALAMSPLKAADGDGSATVHGELKQWHKVTLDVAGPHADEAGAVNPFTDYRMTVTFSNGDLSYEVPGYFAADGKAGESSATAGHVWRAHLSPDRTGTWTYTVDFRQGDEVAIGGGGKEIAPYDGVTGTFAVAATDKTGRDFRAHGRLAYVGGHYLQHLGSKKYFIKVGPDSPETFLAYKGFDNTTSANSRSKVKQYGVHVEDWQDGDPTWKDGKGKGIIGSLNYLAAKGMNVFSFIPYTAGGDGKNVWPMSATTHDDVIKGDAQLRYDCSKLDQWEVVFGHAQKLGLYLHVKTQETENDNNTLKGNKPTAYGLDDGELGIERKLYYRELIARYGHHLALNWNLGEENTNTTEQQKAFADYFAAVDPYHHNVVIHSYPNQIEKVYRPLVGHQALTGMSIQTSFAKVHGQTVKWRRASAEANHKWVVANDEQNPANEGVPPDNGFQDYQDGKSARQPEMHMVLWGNLMAGGAGIESYFGYKLPQNDLNCQDFRSRDKWWDLCRHALEFFDGHLPYNEMAPNDALIGNLESDGRGSYCLAQAGSIYACYLPEGAGTLDLSSAAGSFSVSWYNPRTGGELQAGSVATVTGGAAVDLGQPPAEAGQDWVALVRAAK